MRTIVNTIILLGLLIKCTDTHKQDQGILPTTNKPLKKPGSSFTDTLIIDQASIIFYEPDSIQKKKIKSVTDPQVFEGSMHEFFYQQKHALTYLEKYWPHLRIIKAVNIRYLLFVKQDNSSHFLDLDKLGDSHGIIAFDHTKNAVQLDMTNIETQIPDYFATH